MLSCSSLRKKINKSLFYDVHVFSLSSTSYVSHLLGGAPTRKSILTKTHKYSQQRKKTANGMENKKKTYNLQYVFVHILSLLHHSQSRCPSQMDAMVWAFELSLQYFLLLHFHISVEVVPKIDSCISKFTLW